MVEAGVHYPLCGISGKKNLLGKKGKGKAGITPLRNGVISAVSVIRSGGGIVK